MPKQTAKTLTAQILGSSSPSSPSSPSSGAPQVLGPPKRRLQATEVAASIIGYLESRGTEGATYYEWWSWFSKRQAALDTEAVVEYRGTCTARWYELKRIGLLIPTEVRRSQRDAARDAATKSHKSNRPAQVFILRKGASIIDYVRADKKSLRTPDASRMSVTADEAMLLAEYRRIRRSWTQASTHAQQERLLLKLMNITVKAVNNYKEAA